MPGGKAGDRLSPGHNIAGTRDNPMANLLLTMLRAADDPAECFADSTGPIEELFA